MRAVRGGDPTVRQRVAPNALARDLQRYLNEEPVEAGPPARIYKLRKFAHKHRKPLLAAALFACLLALASVVSVWQAIRATRAEERCSR